MAANVAGFGCAVRGSVPLVSSMTGETPVPRTMILRKAGLLSTLVLGLLIGAAAAGGEPLVDEWPEEHRSSPKGSLVDAELVLQVDRHFKAMLVTGKPLGSGQELGNLIGGPEGHMLLAVALIANDADGPLNLRGAMCEGLVTNALLTDAIKRAVRRQRPDGSEHSWPSGHTSSTVAALTILDAQWGHKSKYTVPLAAVGTLVALSRVQSDRHWLSDTLAGAALGYACGKVASGEAKANSLMATTAGLVAIGMLVRNAECDSADESALDYRQLLPHENQPSGNQWRAGVVVWQRQF